MAFLLRPALVTCPHILRLIGGVGTNSSISLNHRAGLSETTTFISLTPIRPYTVQNNLRRHLV